MKLSVKTVKKTGYLAKMAIFYIFWPKNPWFWIFPWVPLLAHARRHIGEDFRKFSAKTNDKKLKLSVINLQKTGFLAKMAIFWQFLAKKVKNFEFFHGNHYSHTLEDTQVKTLGSFQPKLMTKIEDISQKPSKNWIFGKNGHFLTLFG